MTDDDRALLDDPSSLFHLTTPDGWAAAQRSGEVVPPGFAAEGFVHCSTGAQLLGTIDRHFGGHDELVLLLLDPAAVADQLRWEESRPGEAYPHVYRPLGPVDVAAVITWRRG